MEKDVCLNINELGIILSALQLLDTRDELMLAKEYGSAGAIHDRLKDVYDNMDKSVIRLTYDIEPSF